MRIAMLAPINRRIPPRPYGPEEQLISDLVEGLVERGHQLMLFATANSLTRAELVAVCPKPLVEWDEDVWPEPRWWEEMHIAECMLLAARGEFDLVHNHMHAKALPFMGALSTPVLTTLHGAARDRQLHNILLRFREFPFTAMEAEERSHLPELNYVAEIPFPRPEESNSIVRMVDQFESLYYDIVAGRIHSWLPHWRRCDSWGSTEPLVDSPEARVTKVTLAPTKSLVPGTAYPRAGLWTVLSGTVHLRTADKTEILQPGQTAEILPAGSEELRNPGPESAVLIQIQNRPRHK